MDWSLQLSVCLCLSVSVCLSLSLSVCLFLPVSVCTVEKWRYEFCCLCMANLQNYSPCHWLSITLLQTLSVLIPYSPLHYMFANTRIKTAFSGNITLKVYDKRGSDVYTNFVHFSDATYSLYTRWPEVVFVYFSAVHLLVLFKSMSINWTV
jgi:hypothetical protein